MRAEGTSGDCLVQPPAGVSTYQMPKAQAPPAAQGGKHQEGSHFSLVGELEEALQGRNVRLCPRGFFCLSPAPLLMSPSIWPNVRRPSDLLKKKHSCSPNLLDWPHLIYQLAIHQTNRVKHLCTLSGAPTWVPASLWDNALFSCLGHHRPGTAVMVPPESHQHNTGAKKKTKTTIKYRPRPKSWCCSALPSRGARVFLCCMDSSEK